jgi:hypothetical protein
MHRPSIADGDASRGLKSASRISRRESLKKPALASGDETRSR